MTPQSREALETMQKDAGLKNLPTQFTFEMRLAMSGAGPRAYDWSDKPHRLIYDLCDEIERVRALSTPPAAVVEALENLIEIIDNHVDHTAFDDGHNATCSLCDALKTARAALEAMKGGE